MAKIDKGGEPLYSAWCASSAEGDAAPGRTRHPLRTCAPLRYISGSGSDDREHSPAHRRLPNLDGRCPNMLEQSHVQKVGRAHQFAMTETHRDLGGRLLHNAVYSVCGGKQIHSVM